jgi:Na+-driven multidrug efflux pump
MEKSNNSTFLGEEKISKLMLKFSLPCILSLLVSALYNIVDQIFVGNSSLSTLGNAATGVVFPIFIIAQAFAWCFGDGCAAYLNICQGKGDDKNAHKAIGSGITITLICSLVLMAFFYPLKTQILTLFGASENSIGYAVEYFNIILAFFPIYMLSNMMNAVIRADGSPSWSMASMLGGAIVNIILDPVFIFGAKWGMSGAAWATVIGQVVSFVVSLVYYFRTKTFKLTLKSFIPDLKIFSNALKLGASSFITQMTIVIISLVCNIMLAKYGAQSHYGVDIPIAVIGIESKVFTVVINIVVGIVLGCQPILGYNLGAKKYDRVRKVYKNILLCTLIIGLAFTLLFELAPRAVVGIFGKPTNIPNPEDYWDFAEKTFRIFLSLVTFTCTIKMTSIFFQAVGKPIRAVIASMIRDIICFIPLILILPLRFGIEGILWAAPAADLIAMIVAVVLTITYFKSLKKDEKSF